MKKRYKHKIKTQKGQLVFDYFIMTVVVVISLFLETSEATVLADIH